MSFRAAIKKVIERITQRHFFKYLPHGIDFYHDLCRNMPGYQTRCVFDVGANVGQSALRFAEWWPRAKIYCFEPIAETFKELKMNLKNHPNFDSFQIAMGSHAGIKPIFFDKKDSSNSHLLDGQMGYHEEGAIQEAEVVTIDRFCERKSIKQIHFLKIDTEGYDFEVILGAEKLIETQSVDFIQVESGMNPENKKHRSFEQFKNYLESKKYLLFGVYEQVQEFMPKKPYLRRSNLIFISRRAAEG